MNLMVRWEMKTEECKVIKRKRTCPACNRYLYLREFKITRCKDRQWRSRYCDDCRRAKYREYKREQYNKTRSKDGIKHASDGRLIVKKGSSVKLYWGEVKLQDFKRLFPYNTNEDLAVRFECSVRTVCRKARELGLEKDADWMRSVWDNNIRTAHFINTLPSTPKADLTNFVQGGKKHRYQSGTGNKKTKEERSEMAKRAWVTRKKNARMKATKVKEIES